MKRSEFRTLYDTYMRKTDQDPLSEMHTLDYGVRLVWHAQSAGMLSYSDLTADTADAAIQAELDYFETLAYNFEWKCFSYDTPADLGQRLVKHGLEQDEREAVMILPIDEAPQKLLQAPTFHIEQATTKQHFKDLDAIFYEVWQDDPFTAATPTRMSDWLLPRYEAYPDSLAIFIVYVDQRPVSYGRVEFAEGNPFASIWGGSTIEAYRNQGIYTQVVAARLRAAKARGCHYLTVDARHNTSKPILEKLGFIHIADATAYNWHPPE